MAIAFVCNIRNRTKNIFSNGVLYPNLFYHIHVDKHQFFISRVSLKKFFLVMGLVATILVVAVICVSLGLGVSARPKEDSFGPSPVVPLISDTTKAKPGPPISSSILGNYSTAAVSVDGKPCADIGL